MAEGPSSLVDSRDVVLVERGDFAVMLDLFY